MTTKFNPLAKKGFDKIGMSEAEVSAAHLKLDQTTPQTITDGIPLLTGLTPTTDYQIATKKYVDDNAGGASSNSAKYFVKDVADEFTIYSGVNGTTDDEADTNWEVLKIAKTGNDNILRTIYTATGAWADRAMLSYSTKYNYEV